MNLKTGCFRLRGEFLDEIKSIGIRIAGEEYKAIIGRLKAIPK
jgi:hypothetical protein